VIGAGRCVTACRRDDEPSRFLAWRALRRRLNDLTAAKRRARRLIPGRNGRRRPSLLPGHDNIPMATRRAPNTKQSIVNVGDGLASFGGCCCCRPCPASVSFARFSQPRLLAFHLKRRTGSHRLRHYHVILSSSCSRQYIDNHNV